MNKLIDIGTDRRNERHDLDIFVLLRASMSIHYVGGNNLGGEVGAVGPYYDILAKLSI